MPATLEKLIKVRSQLVEEVLDYLNGIAERLGTLPSDWYPIGTQFDNVRIPNRLARRQRVYDLQSLRDKERQTPYRWRHEYLQETRSREVECVEWEEIRKKTKRGVILGDPGFGKTWFLKCEGRRIAQESLKQIVAQERSIDQVEIPIFIRLPDLARATGNLPDALVRLLRRDFQHESAQLSVEFIRLIKNAISHGNCVLLLDGLDEVPQDSEGEPLRQNLIERLKRFTFNIPLCRVLLTSRIVGYAGPPFPAAQEMELLPLDQTQQDMFIQTWFQQHEAASKLQHKIRSYVQLRGLARVPLLLGLICKSYWHGSLTLPLRRVELYDRCVRGLLSKEWKEGTPRTEPGFVDAKLEIAEEIAFYMFARNKEIFSIRELRRALEETLENLPAHHELKNKNPSELIREFSESDGLLLRSGTQDDTSYTFLHLTFQEYLSGRALASRSDHLDLMDLYGLELHWQEVLKVAMEYIEDATRVMHHFCPPPEMSDEHKRIAIGGSVRNRLYWCGELLAHTNSVDKSLRSSIIESIFAGALSEKYTNYGQYSALTELGISDIDVRKRLYEFLSRGTDKERLLAAKILREIADPEDMDVLFKAIFDVSPIVATTTGDALVRINNASVASKALSRIEQITPEARASIMRDIVEIAGEDFIGAVLQRAEELNQLDEAIYRIACIGKDSVLRKVTETVGERRLLNVLDSGLGNRHCSNCYIAPLEITLLLQVGSEDAISVLRNHLYYYDYDWDDEKECSCVANALAQIESPQDGESDEFEEVALPSSNQSKVGNPDLAPLLACLVHRKREVVIQAAREIASYGPKAAVTPYGQKILALLNHRSRHTREAAADLAGVLAIVEARDSLLKLLTDTEPWVAGSAWQSLERIVTEEDCRALCDCLNEIQYPTKNLVRPPVSSSKDSITALLQLISSVGTPVAIPPLTEFMKKNPSRASEAADVIKVIRRRYQIFYGSRWETKSSANCEVSEPVAFATRRDVIRSYEENHSRRGVWATIQRWLSTISRRSNKR